MKNWEVIKALAENPTLTFKNLRFGGVAGYIGNGKLAWISGSDKIGAAFEIHYAPDSGGGNWNDDWELAPQEVTWQEAIQKWSEGKDVICHINNYKYLFKAEVAFFRDNEGIAISRDILLNGKWFVE